MLDFLHRNHDFTFSKKFKIFYSLYKVTRTSSPCSDYSFLSGTHKLMTLLTLNGVKTIIFKGETSLGFCKKEERYFNRLLALEID